MVSEEFCQLLTEIKERVINAICALYRNDLILLEIDANERSVTHKLGEYLKREFAEWDVDCEYNRRAGEPKRLNISSDSISPGHTAAKTVIPDVIVHRRNKNENLLIIEFKKDGGDQIRNDEAKIKAFTKDENYKYQYGLLLELGPKHCTHAGLFQNGEQIEDLSSEINSLLKEWGYAE